MKDKSESIVEATIYEEGKELLIEGSIIKCTDIPLIDEDGNYVDFTGKRARFYDIIDKDGNVWEYIPEENIRFDYEQ